MRIAIASPDIARAMREETRLGEQAIKAGAVAGARAGQDFLRRETAAVFGSRVSMTWRGVAYPERGASVDAAATLAPRGGEITRRMIDAAAQGSPATIRAARSRWLALPTKEANVLLRGKRKPNVSPVDIVAALVGPMQFVRKRDGTAMLIAQARVTKGGRVRSLARRRKDGSMASSLRGRASVVMFLLKPLVRSPKQKIDLRRATGIMVDAFDAGVSSRFRRNAP